MPNERSRPRLLYSLLGLCVSLLVALPAQAADEFPATAFFLDGLTAESRWSEILSKPGLKAELPFMGFGPTFVALDDVCVDGPLLAIANPGMDGDVRTSAETLRTLVAAATVDGHVPPLGPQFVAATPTEPPRRVAMQYPVRVFKVIDRAPNPVRIYLFEKFWPVPVCPGR
jgi:hypothetical protein